MESSHSSVFSHREEKERAASVRVSISLSGQGCLLPGNMVHHVILCMTEPWCGGIALVKMLIKTDTVRRGLMSLQYIWDIQCFFLTCLPWAGCDVKTQEMLYLKDRTGLSNTSRCIALPYSDLTKAWIYTKSTLKYWNQNPISIIFE